MGSMLDVQLRVLVLPRIDSQLSMAGSGRLISMYDRAWP
jgi:hypothetical protein